MTRAANLAEAAGSGFAFRNRIINGDMRIDQRNAGASLASSPSAPYTLDRWQSNCPSGGGFSVQQVSDAPDGFSNSLKITVTAAKSSVTSSDEFMLRQSVEGNNFFDFSFGTSTAKSITLSFWAKSSLTGTFGGALRNLSADRGYAFTYSINSANTWEYKTIVITGDTAGTWATGSTVGVRLQFDLGCGDALRASAGSWVAGVSVVGATGAVRLINTLNATLQITGVQLEKGTAATPFEFRPYSTELALCQRYYYKTAGNLYSFFGWGKGYTTGNGQFVMPLPVTMRVIPSLGYSALSDVFLETGATVVQSITGLAINGSVTTNSLGFDVSKAGAFTAGALYWLIANNLTTAYIAASAEL